MILKPQINWALYRDIAVKTLPSRGLRKADRTFNSGTAQPKSSSRQGLSLEPASQPRRKK